jgi:protein-S-isoprenylcysteine O-methyltransferase Ste14
VTEILPYTIMVIILFVSSGRIDWTMAWAFLIINFVFNLFAMLILSPSEIEKRWESTKLAKKWDLAIMAPMGSFVIVSILVAGLDMRFSWSGQAPQLIQVVAIASYIIGYGLYIWAMASNKFFSHIAHIQGESHTVAMGGPYRYVRHPGYLGSIIYLFAQPLMLGSYLALVPMVVSVILMIARTSLEDRMLREELPGYDEYVMRVRYRLLPGVW